MKYKYSNCRDLSHVTCLATTPPIIYGEVCA